MEQTRLDAAMLAASKIHRLEDEIERWSCGNRTDPFSNDLHSSMPRISNETKRHITACALEDLRAQLSTAQAEFDAL